MSEQNAIVITEPRNYFLAPAASLQQLKERYKLFGEFVKEVLKKDVDYQVIPGTDKETLIKPGAEKLATLFALSARFILADKTEDWMGETHGGEPFFDFKYRCELYRGEQFIASCDGSCNSWEKKYRFRQAERVCPKCGKATIIKGKEEYGGGWLCFTKKGGCNAKFAVGDKSIEGQQVGQVPNSDIFDQVNTFQKMAQKRAYVGAVLIATNASEYFTQDLDDHPETVTGEWKRDEPKQATKPEPTMKETAVELGGTVVGEPSAVMTLEMAESEIDEKGTPYGQIELARLTYMHNNLMKSLKDNGLSQEEHIEKQRKLDACKVIIADRRSKK